MHHALQWILDTAPNWAFGLILVAILRWISAKGLSFFLTELVDLPGRLQTEDDAQDVWDRARAGDQASSEGLSASLATVLPVVVLGWWVTIDLWRLLQSSANPSPSLGEHAFLSAALVWVLVVVLGWIEYRDRIIAWRSDVDLRSIVTLLTLFALTQLVLLMVAPFGLHIYWLALRVLGAADERWFATRARGPDIRSS